jgi:hypothetical protein
MTLVVMLGCTSRESLRNLPEDNRKPLLFQLQEQDTSLEGQRVRTLLDFEHESDLVFTESEGPISLSSLAQTGQFSLQFSHSVVTFRIHSVLFSTAFPGEWTLLGAYARPQIDTSVQTELLDGETVLAQSRKTIPAGRWTFVGIDLTRRLAEIQSSKDKQFQFRVIFDASGGLATTLIDNVVLINNTRTLLDTRSNPIMGWVIRQQGYTTQIEAPGRFNIKALTPAAIDSGWVVSEYNSTRIILRSAKPVRTWVLYSDGRVIQDGQIRIHGSLETDVAAAHQTPAIVQPDETTVMLRVHTPGDSDNDGYNEVLGAYQLSAKGARIQFTLRPRTTSCVAPFFEISDLPPGVVTTTVEGRLIDSAERLSDGRVLLRLPLRVDRPMTVTVRSRPTP